MTENKPTYGHWSSDQDARAAFAQAVSDLGIAGESVPDILGVERVSDFQGTPDAAIEALVEYAAQHRQDVRDQLRPADPFHAEAMAIAWTNAFLPDGTQVNITARQGAAPDDIVATVLALQEALDTLKTFGIRTSKPAPRPATKPAASAPGATDFWNAVYRYIGNGRPFENKQAVTNWLTQFSTGHGIHWTDAIKALHGFDVTRSAEVQTEPDF